MKNFLLILFIFTLSSFAQEAGKQANEKNWFQEFMDKIDNEYGWGNNAKKKIVNKKKEKNGWNKFWDEVDYTFDSLIEDEKRINDSLRDRTPAKLEPEKKEEQKIIKKINKE